MNFQQLKIIQEAVRCNFNLTEVANALFTSQSGVSKHIKDLEDELGVELFIRRGKRLLGMTEPGKEMVEIVRRMLLDANNIRQLAAQFSNRDQGKLCVATTHTQARYALPPVIAAFKKAYPRVHLKLLQGNPHQLARWVLDGEAQLAIATEALDQYEALVALPGYQWHHGVVVPSRHALTRMKPLTLEAIAKYPIVTYDPTFAGRSAIDGAFARRGLAPDVVMTALDSDVIKSYVALGLGVGLISSRAYERGRDKGLALLEAAHLFPVQTTRLAFRRGTRLRAFEKAFIRLFVPHLGAEGLDRLAGAAGEDFAI